ncbi:hypothetical protein B0J18DRAFT_57877 [Chaetomium sp. MPI-SDFR-AT-0129]|nr:hypothetical protein B0J18DRAFT_57877 [Chaetomium sp. MPI-SDFR-AT-0129]
MSEINSRHTKVLRSPPSRVSGLEAVQPNIEGCSDRHAPEVENYGAESIESIQHSLPSFPTQSGDGESADSAGHQGCKADSPEAVLRSRPSFCEPTPIPVLLHTILELTEIASPPGCRPSRAGFYYLGSQCRHQFSVPNRHRTGSSSARCFPAELWTKSETDNRTKIGRRGDTGHSLFPVGGPTPLSRFASPKIRLATHSTFHFFFSRSLVPASAPARGY